MILYCQICGEKIEQENFGRYDLCPNCNSYLKACVQCKNYSPGSYHDCNEPTAEEVTDKEAANFCEFFIPNDTPPNKSKSSSKDKILEELDSLFKK